MCKLLQGTFIDLSGLLQKQRIWADYLNPAIHHNRVGQDFSDPLFVKKPVRREQPSNAINAARENCLVIDK